MATSTRTLIMSPERVRRMLRRLASELVEHNQGAETLELFGILESGAPLARAVAREIASIEDRPVPVHDLDVTPYRDDHDGEVPAPNRCAIDVTERDVILVDDVLFTGRTARAALDAVLQYGRPRSIQLLVLVDRGHREYPIQPDYTGRHLPTKHRERVTVATDARFAIYIED